MAKKKVALGDQVVTQRKSGLSYEQIRQAHAEAATARITVTIRPLQALEAQLVEAAVTLFGELKDWNLVGAQLVGRADIPKMKLRYAEALKDVALAEARRRIAQASPQEERRSPPPDRPAGARKHAAPRTTRSMFPPVTPIPAP